MPFRTGMKHIINLMAAEGQHSVKYRDADLSAILRSDGKKKPKRTEYHGDAANILELQNLIRRMVGETGLFWCRDKPISYPESMLCVQTGVIRSNCIDCLDRTNNFQLYIGREVMKKQVPLIISTS